MRTAASLLLLGFICAACSTPVKYPIVTQFAPAETAGKESLFSGDSAVLSDAEIDRILKFNYVPPAQSRVAVLALGQETWLGYSDELARSGEEIRGEFTAQLKTASTVTSASYLPSLLIPSRRSVASFREAAARYQADLLVVYQTSCRTYEKYRMFSANTSKSFCNVEALVLDVRTGLVPFTTVATQELTVNQSDSEINSYETMRKAELGAIRDALGRIGTSVSAYLGRR
jgi:hypothetical protein